MRDEKASLAKMCINDACWCACVSRSIIHAIRDPARQMTPTTDAQVIISARRRSRRRAIGDVVFSFIAFASC